MTLLERSLPWTTRFLNRFTLIKGWHFFKHWGRRGLWILPALWGLWYLTSKVMESAYSLDLRSIEYSSNGIIPREYTLKLLDIKEKVNLTSINVKEFEQRLLASPAIASARVQKELPSTLRIEVEARVPVVRLAYEESPAWEGTERPMLFMDPDGYIFPYEETLHTDYKDLPVWNVTPVQVTPLRSGARVRPRECTPVIELMRLINMRPITDIPAVASISRPKDWQILLLLENGTEVQMTVYNLSEQVDRLSLVLENARARHKFIRRANVIPRTNPAVEYGDPPVVLPHEDEEAPIAEEVPED